jgi:hypothetical protein
MTTLPFAGSASINDASTLALLDAIKLNVTPPPISAFLTDYRKWVASSSSNTMDGFDLFSVAEYCNGSTEAFDKFYIRNHSRRFRIFRGEYLYHAMTWLDCKHDWKYVEDGPLEENDALLVSVPFAGTGNVHEQFDEVMEECGRLYIPVLVDCTYFGICSNVHFNFDHSAIKEVVFSLSKVFPISKMRVAMRLSAGDFDDGISAYNKIGYVNEYSAAIGHQFIQAFGPDYIPTKYKDAQQEFCAFLNVAPSNTVIYGIGDDNWAAYKRGIRENDTNRLSFHRFLHDKQKFYDAI